MDSSEARLFATPTEAGKGSPPWALRAGLEVLEPAEVFTTQLPVRWSDMDAQGHVNNGVFLDYLQDARVDFLLAGGVPQMLDQGVLAVDHTIEYRAPLVYSPHPVEVRMALVQRGRARFRVGYLVVHDDTLCALAVTTLVPFDLATQRPCRMTPAEAAHFDRFRWRLSSPFRELPRPALAGRGHLTPVQTRWSDVDRYQHVNNVKMLEFYQEARIAMTVAADPSAARVGTPGEPGERAHWVIARQDIDYVAQMSFRREPFHVHTAVTRIGTSSVTMASELVDPLQDAVVSRSRSVLVCTDPEGGPQPIPASVRAGLEGFLLEA